ncbi:ABC transporter permease [Paenibacillus sp. J31TS4]|uniref:carbohydrate ABC transporter permease n=1 Tax=Paenibacillus sp. J31TS4 TaxID=2807195 RepID=UPI001B10E04A|nr:carbohydrate ABC transporter permease [Paenibacillus sp. J31TS4]GIP40706.1 ABC transporter permease [Paenibacillus sp. J31TS4]
MPAYRSDRRFQLANDLFLVLVSLTMFAPLLHLAAVSLSAPEYVGAKLVTFWPRGFSLEVYRTIFGTSSLWRAMGVSVYITVVGTLLALLFTSTIAYSLSRPQMPLRGWILKGIVLTFVFSVPLIPSYLLVRTLQMDNTLWALMVPGALSAFNVFIMKTFFQGLSAELFDAAKMDGCSELGIYARIAIPLSSPVIATIGLFHAVGQWNSYFSALIYIKTKTLLPIQVLLRNLVVEDGLGSMSQIQTVDLSRTSTPEMMKAGILLFATLPILIVYPFLQKYFVKGAMLGSLKE